MRAARAILMLLLGGAATLPAQTSAYDQPYRPQVHFSPREHWTNDPNGLVFYQGEYHLFFQFNPFGDQWGHMSWGHAVSADLVHWKELPVAIPEHDGEMIFTGSVVVDHGNTSGFCGTAKDCLVAVYTGHREKPALLQTQNVAYSLDRGRSWTTYKNNPVLDLHMADFRDPSVSWNPATKRWVMAVSLPKKHKVRFYGSPDLKQWTMLSDFGPAGDVAGDWECPDLLQVRGSKGSMWALKVGLNPGAPQGGSGEQYFLGSFDGTRFVVSDRAGAHGWTNYGKDDYCAISFNDLPQGHKPVLLGWMSNWQYAAKLPTSPWRGQMSVPRELSLIEDKGGLALRQTPVLEPGTLGPLRDARPMGVPVELRARFDAGAARQFGMKLYSDEAHWTEIGFDRDARVFYIDRTHSGATVSDEFPGRTVAPLADGRPFDVTVIVDRSSLEAYAQDGTIAMTDLVFPASTSMKAVMFPEDVKVSAESRELQSIWK